MLHFFEEKNISIHLADLELIEHVKSKRGQIQLFSHKVLGRILLIDDEIQHIEAWASLYHEHLVHIPSSFIPEIKRVLILGGGSLFAANEVLKYPTVDKVTMVDFNPEVIEVVKRNYPHASAILNNVRFDLQIDDCVTFLERCTSNYDLILNDAVDLLSVANGNSPFDLLASRLTSSGVCGDLIYRHIFEQERCQETVRLLKNNYQTAFSLTVVPEYPGILHLLSMWGTPNDLNQNRSEVLNKIQKDWIRDKKSPCAFYDPRFIEYYLYLPPYLKKLVNTTE